MEKFEFFYKECKTCKRILQHNEIFGNYCVNCYESNIEDEDN